MNNKPLVSVCVVTYQHVNYIKQCLDSILMQQTTFSFEIVLGEDESTDGTREICKDYAARYPDKIRLFLRNRKDVMYINGTPTGRFNFIENIKSCKGEYIAYCDGDDYWTDPLKLQKQVDFLEENPRYVLSSHNADVIDVNGKLIKENVIKYKNQYRYSGEDLIIGVQIVMLTICFKNILNKFPKEFYEVVNGDTFLIGMLGQYGDAKIHNDITNGIYRSHPGGIWSHKSGIQKKEDLMNLYWTKFNFFKRTTNSNVTYQLFYKYFDKSKNLIVIEYRFKNYSNVVKVYFKTLLNCFVNGFYKECIKLTGFLFMKFFKVLFK